MALEITTYKEGVMNINNYVDYFHDGVLCAIDYINNNIIIALTSCELFPEDLVDDAATSDDYSLHGKFHIEGVKEIIFEEKTLTEKLKMKHICGSIFDLKLSPQTIELQIVWDTPDLYTPDFSVIQIQAQNIWWENLPNSCNRYLYDE